MMPRLVAATVAALLLMTASAAAVPGDPAVEALSPEAGATVPANPAGITVSFTCPGYTKRYADELFPAETGTAADYSAAFSTSSDRRPDGRLATTIAIGAVTERGDRPGTCDALLGSGDPPSPQSTPGTYFWQAWRDCPSCTTGFEVGPVVRFVIGATGRPRLEAPGRAYAGYPFVVRASYAGSGRRTRVQRRAGKRWRTVATVPGSGGKPIVTLRRGRQRLRALVEDGSEVVAGRTAVVRVLRARGWSTGARDDGAYRDPKRASVHLRVRRAGRRITGLRADVPTVCGDPTSSTGIAPNIVSVTLPPVRVAPDGRFALSGTYRGGQAVRFTGRLARRRLVGARLATDTGGCAGSIAVQARRTSG